MSLVELKNLGPKSCLMLDQVGITNISQLNELGPVRAFLAVRQSYTHVSLNLLWAIAGALKNQHWAKLDLDYKLDLKQELKELGYEFLD